MPEPLLPEGKLKWTPVVKLKYDFFKASPDSTSAAPSYSESRVELNYTCKNNFFQPIINAYFDCNKSWIKDVNDPNLLALEQLKFTIAHFQAIKLQKKLSLLSRPCSLKPKEMELIVQEANYECKKLQSEAEFMSDFGKKSSIIEMWKLRIEVELESMMNHNKIRNLAQRD